MNISAPFCESGRNVQDAKKVRSRRAAQSRRYHENSEFLSLAESLPLSRAIVSQLDKATIVRLTMSYLNLRNFMESTGDWMIMEPPSPQQSQDIGRNDPEGFIQREGSRLLEAFDGFVFALDKQNDFIYVSETVSIGLGLSQIDMLGLPFLDYVHPSERAVVDERLESLKNNNSDVLKGKFCIRMKSNLVKRATKEATEGILGYKFRLHQPPIFLADLFHNFAQLESVPNQIQLCRSWLTSFPECRDLISRSFRRLCFKI